MNLTVTLDTWLKPEDAVAEVERALTVAFGQLARVEVGIAELPDHEWFGEPLEHRNVTQARVDNWPHDEPFSVTDNICDVCGFFYGTHGEGLSHARNG